MIRTYFIIFSFICCLSLIGACSADQSSHTNEHEKAGTDTVPPLDFSIIDRWEAGSVVDSTLVYSYGIEKCFTSDSISISLFSKMEGRTYHENTPVKLTDLSYLKILHKDSEGRILLGEMICNRSIAADLLDIFSQLFHAGYPVERMVLPSNYGGDDEASMTANNTSCFNSRTISGSAKPSKHAYGLAVDINPLYNPYIKERNGKVVRILPHAAKYPVPRSPYRIEKGDLCYQLFIKHGFKWGGAWRSVKDYQHFEKDH